ncbi:MULTISPECIES: tetratricopeptide repeat protein [Anaeromyxobacter]|uniref:tetratricopeptide repeat protein n=3 Tax=Anaeromyxobacteraceae TaxID=1524215 RepID=UPI001F58C23E|nr:MULTISPECIES: tetratricopeptide repeat protein [unclassified Anaeromyxobacter]
MAHRGSPILLVALLSLAAPVLAAAQLAPPRLVVEGEETAEEAVPTLVPPAPAAARPAGGGTLSTPGAAGSAQRSPPVPADVPPSDASVRPGPSAAPPPASEVRLPPAERARRIVPVSTTYAQLMRRWAERRDALRDGDPARADAAAEALLGAQRELGIENLVPLAVAETRAVSRALASDLVAEAVAHAQLAVALAPDLPDAHLALALARLAEAPGRAAPVAGALRDTAVAAARDPQTRRAFLADVLAAALAAAITSAVAVLVLLLARRLPLLVHDFHHLPLVRGTARVQAGFLAIVLLLAPLAFGLGPLVALAVLALAAWPYLARAERAVATAALAALLAVPWASGAAARATAWTGTLAERVQAVEHGAASDEDAAALEAAAGEPAPAVVHAALGRFAKRRGDLAGALRHYRAAAAADERAPELSVNLGNALFLAGDLEGARAAYLAASDRAAGDPLVQGAASYGLSKLYLRTAEMDRSAAAREKAEAQAGAFLRARGSDDDFSANRWLVDLPIPEGRLAALANADGAAGRVRAWAEARLAGTLPRAALPWAGVGFLAALWLLSALAPRLGPSRACEGCGGAACRRCGPASDVRCGQCVNAFERRGLVDARDRLRKEAQIRRHARLSALSARILALVGGGAGPLWSGAPVRGALLLLALLFLGFVVWFWRGVLPPPEATPWVLAGKLAVAAPLALLAWGLAVRDAFRRTR